LKNEKLDVQNTKIDRILKKKKYDQMQQRFVEQQKRIKKTQKIKANILFN